MGTLIARWTRPIGWASLSQAMSSSTNFGLYVMLLLTLDGADFGRVVALLAAYQLMLTVARPLVSEPMLANAGEGGAAEMACDLNAIWTASRRKLWFIGIAGGLVIIAVGHMVGEWSPITFGLAGGMCLLMQQDGQRYLAWVAGVPRLTVLSDLTWLLSAMILLGGASALGPLSGLRIVAIWMLGGLASAMFGHRFIERRCRSRLASQQQRPSSRKPTVGHRRQLELGRSQALNAAAFNIMPIAVAMFISPFAAGVMRASLLPFAPTLALLAGMRVVTLPALNRAATGTTAVVVGKGAGVEPNTVQKGGGELDTATVRILNYMVPAVCVLVAVTAGLAALLANRLQITESVSAQSIAWGGAIAVMSIAGTQLADSLGMGRRRIDVVRRRIAAVACEWSVLFGVVSIAGTGYLMGGWAVGVAVASILWLAPSFTPGIGLPAGHVSASAPGV